MKRSLEQSSACEPVMPVAEGCDPVVERQARLGLSHLWQSKVIEAEVCGEQRLPVSPEQRTRAGYIRPLGKSGTPPLVILRCWVKLRQVEGDSACARLLLRW